MAKVRYEVDPHNRLVIKDSGKKSEIRRYRTILDGRFKLDKNNSLVYHAKLPSEKRELQQIRLRGNWALDKNHNLKYSLNKWGNQIAGNKLTIKGSFISFKANEIGFEVLSKEKDGSRSIYILKLGGKWKADKNNRLIFNVQKEKNADILRFEGGWKVKNNQITYTYSKHRETRGRQNLILSGYWDIREKYRLNYILDKDLGSGFEFRTSVGYPARAGNRRGLEYELGIGASYKKEPIKKSIIIFGKWRLHERLGLLFDVEYDRGVVRSIDFGASIKLNKDNTLTLNLNDRGGSKLGTSVKLSRRLLGNSEAFIKLLKAQEEKAIQIGLGFRW